MGLITIVYSYYNTCYIMVSLPPMPESFLTYTVTNYIILCNYEDTGLVGLKTGSLLLFENDLMCVCVCEVLRRRTFVIDLCFDNLSGR